MIAGDGALSFQSKSADYYQSSLINVSRELNFKDSGLYVYNQVKTQGKTFFPIPLKLVEFTAVFSFQINIVLKLQRLIYQKLSLFVAQSVFINEIITSNTPY